MFREFTLLILCATLLPIARVVHSRQLAGIGNNDWQFLLPDHQIEIEPIKHRTLKRFLRTNDNVKATSCHQTMVDGLTRTADEFLTKMDDCPKTLAHQIDFVHIEKPARDIKKRLLEVSERCQNLRSACLERNVGRYHEVNSLVIDITKNMLFMNAKKADNCKLSSARALLGAAAAFISDIKYCSEIKI